MKENIERQNIYEKLDEDPLREYIRKVNKMEEESWKYDVSYIGRKDKTWVKDSLHKNYLLISQMMLSKTDKEKIEKLDISSIN